MVSNKYVCGRCGKLFDRDNMEEHHIIPRAILKFPFTDQYRILLCKKCHKKCTDEFIKNRLVWLPGNIFLKVVDRGE